LLVWSVGVGVLDNYLRPILIRRGADLPEFLPVAEFKRRYGGIGGRAYNNIMAKI
jgi:hypothetical protein